MKHEMETEQAIAAEKAKLIEEENKKEEEQNKANQNQSLT